MRKILVPTDGSECSNLAIDKAIDLAKKFGSELVILHVIDTKAASSFMNAGYASVMVRPAQDFNPALSSNASPPVLPSQDGFLDKLREKAEGYLESAKARCTVIKDKVSTILLEGNPAESIIEYAEGNDIDLVVMCSQGMSRSSFKRFFMGSVTHKVAVSIEKSIYIIR